MLQFYLTETVMAPSSKKHSKVVFIVLRSVLGGITIGCGGTRGIVKQFENKRFAAVICPPFRRSNGDIAQLRIHSLLWRTAEFAILGYLVAAFCNVPEIDTMERRT
jgi:hypothetical protein